MSRTRKKSHRSQSTPMPPSRDHHGLYRIAIVLALVAVAGLLGAWMWNRSQTPTTPPTPPPSLAETTTPAVAATEARPEFQKIKGRWLRPDGGYIVDVKNVDDGGRMDASYFNPRSIHVAKAEVSQDGSVTKVFIELRDVNYPGSTYNLTYDPQNDRLEGIYYQAALQQSFDVFFVRMK
jgi:hypothetical protein